MLIVPATFLNLSLRLTAINELCCLDHRPNKFLLSILRDYSSASFRIYRNFDIFAKNYRLTTEQTLPGFFNYSKFRSFKFDEDGLTCMVHISYTILSGKYCKNRFSGGILDSLEPGLVWIFYRIIEPWSSLSALLRILQLDYWLVYALRNERIQSYIEYGDFIKIYKITKIQCLLWFYDI